MKSNVKALFMDRINEWNIFGTDESNKENLANQTKNSLQIIGSLKFSIKILSGANEKGRLIEYNSNVKENPLKS